MQFPILYKRTVTGKIQQWQITTCGNTIITTQGQQNGKMQVYKDIITAGKNIGKANETTSEQQADLEAQSRWTKKHNKDYHVNIQACQVTVKIANTGGYLPMLAHKHKDHATKYLKYPCYVQPKLDGIRCIATREDDKIKLWFRGGKQINTMQHIVDDLFKIMPNGDIWDGELYDHGEDFSKFTGAIRANKNLNPEVTTKIKYHIYDFPRIGGLNESYRYGHRLDKFHYLMLSFNVSSIVKVETFIVNSFEEAMEYYTKFITQGYEGIMFRNINTPYEQKRSYNLLKHKEFIDDEFEIIGVIEGRGILKGHAGSFICKVEANRILKDIGRKTHSSPIELFFEAKLKGSHKRLKHLFEHPKEYMHKQLTVIYQNLLASGKPRFGVGKEIRFDL